MKIDYNELKKYPEIMNKEQLRTVCHISKRTSLYLLRSGLIPNETTGKKTRCYRIRKSDVIAFLKDREAHPSKYLAPDNWYRYGISDMKDCKIHPMPDLPDRETLQAFYEERLSAFQDVMDVSAVVTFTGYNRRTVGEWIRKARLKAVLYNGRYIIPKNYLLDWLCSEEYNRITRKSEVHISTLWEIGRDNQLFTSLNQFHFLISQCPLRLVPT